MVRGREEGVKGRGKGNILLSFHNSTGHTANRDLWRNFLELRTGDRGELIEDWKGLTGDGGIGECGEWR